MITAERYSNLRQALFKAAAPDEAQEAFRTLFSNHNHSIDFDSISPTDKLALLKERIEEVNGLSLMLASDEELLSHARKQRALMFDPVI